MNRILKKKVYCIHKIIRYSSILMKKLNHLKVQILRKHLIKINKSVWFLKMNHINHSSMKMLKNLNLKDRKAHNQKKKRKKPKTRMNHIMKFKDHIQGIT